MKYRSKYICVCPKCKAEADVITSKISMACPPSYTYVCPRCGDTGLVRCNEIIIIEEK